MPITRQIDESVMLIKARILPSIALMSVLSASTQSGKAARRVVGMSGIAEQSSMITADAPNTVKTNVDSSFVHLRNVHTPLQEVDRYTRMSGTQCSQGIVDIFICIGGQYEDICAGRNLQL